VFSTSVGKTARRTVVDLTTLSGRYASAGQRRQSQHHVAQAGAASRNPASVSSDPNVETSFSSRRPLSKTLVGTGPGTDVDRRSCSRPRGRSRGRFESVCLALAAGATTRWRSRRRP
jgi:hypothetical protein